MYFTEISRCLITTIFTPVYLIRILLIRTSIIIVSLLTKGTCRVFLYPVLFNMFFIFESFYSFTILLLLILKFTNSFIKFFTNFFISPISFLFIPSAFSSLCYYSHSVHIFFITILWDFLWFFPAVSSCWCYLLMY